MALFPGLRLLRQDPWECLASFILSAHCHIPRIQRNVEALAKEAGTPIQAWGRTVYSFPSREHVAALGEAHLRGLGLGFRAKNLAATARLLVDRVVDLESLRSKPYEEARESLLSLPGVGPKIADCVLAFSLDHTQAFPVDRWVLRGLQRLYLGEGRIAEEKAAKWARDRFGVHAAYAQQLLFHLERTQGLETRPLPGSRAHRATMTPPPSISALAPARRRRS
jgi:N-glycosylase/DNA lyase